MRKAAGLAVDAKPCSLLFQLNYLNDSRLSITTMPTIFGRWKSCKLLGWGELLGRNIYWCERGGLTRFWGGGEEHYGATRTPPGSAEAY